jgi:hypothetical protein
VRSGELAGQCAVPLGGDACPGPGFPGRRFESLPVVVAGGQFPARLRHKAVQHRIGRISVHQAKRLRADTALRAPAMSPEITEPRKAGEANHRPQLLCLPSGGLTGVPAMYPRTPPAALRRRVIRCLSEAAWMTPAERRPALSRDGSSPV